jgi:hypothetical protein
MKTGTLQQEEKAWMQHNIRQGTVFMLLGRK